MWAITRGCFFVLLATGVAAAGTISGKINITGELSGEPVAVYLEEVKGKFQPPKKNPEIVQKNQSFQPAVLAVLKGTTVEFPNLDDVFHSAFSFSPSNPFDLGLYGAGSDQWFQMKNPGVVEVFCNIHDNMQSNILVLENPYFSMTTSASTYRIEDIPEGTYKITAWLSRDVVKSKTVSVKAGKMVNLDFNLNAVQVSQR